MDHQDLRTLQLLEALDKDKAPSQRDLAQKLNVSLGLVNSFVKRLAHKGYFKITSIPKNRFKYILTPTGAAEKARLTYEYIKHSYTFYNDTRQKLRKLFQDLTAEGVRNVVFYGAGDFAEIAYLSLQETPIRIAAIVDDQKIGKKFLNGLVIKAPFFLKTLSFDRILITSVRSKEEILENIVKNGIPPERVIVPE